MPCWPDNIEAWLCYTETEFYEHSVTDPCAQFLAAMKALPRKFNRFVTSSMLTCDISETYETLRRSIVKCGDLNRRQVLDQLVNNIDLQHGSATNMLLQMRKMHAVLVPFQKKAVDELVLSADHIIQIDKSSNAEYFAVKGKPRTTRIETTEICHTLTR
ncbi:unnamed protein product [Schistosoma curassoni]|uniref:Uncharacterized protein n=1 Tax=Schistosoma curassoni TaxID=6186 RepID=A0A183L4J7_9TREM|nr:unnamed protein product [Schistosoma curassoni]